MVFNKSVFVDSTAERESNIVRANAAIRSSGEIDQRYFRIGDIIGISQQLFYDFRSAFSHCHGAEGSVAGMAVGTEDHLSATGHHLAGKLVDDRLICRHVDAAELPRRRKSEYMIIFIDRTAHCAETVMAVGHGIGDGEFFKPGRDGSLNDSHVCNIVRNQIVKINIQFRAGALVVRRQDLSRHGFPGAGFYRSLTDFARSAVMPYDRFIDFGDHNCPLLFINVLN